jgi:hypothetical protein
MFILRDLYTQVEYSSITSSNVTLGQTIVQYEVRSYNDTRNLGNVKSYLVTCTQRLVLPNPTAYNPRAASAYSFLNYPALITNNIAISDPNSIVQSKWLLDYSPRTLNASVATTLSSGQSQGLTVSQQSTTGSSTAQTNSYGVSASGGFMGDVPTGDISANYQYSTTNEQFRSATQGNAVERGTQLSNSNAMTIKDWGSYAQLDVGDQTPTWTWGQEYPWNVIQFKGTDNDGNIALPTFVAQRLYDGTILYPPSELSLFGVDFVSKATWLVTPKPHLAGPQEIQFNHALYYDAGSHKLSGGTSGNLVTNLNTYGPIPYQSQTLDLPVMALDPVRVADNRAAVIGFVANQFDVPPTSSGSAFAITAETNDLLVRGSGFNGVMSTNFSTGTVQMTLSFKIVDRTSDVSLSLKHWNQGPAVQLSILVNNATTITRFVDSPETGSGGDNVTVVMLRNKDFTSVDYCDLLQMGLNTVTITITPVAPGAAYQLMAMAVG